MGESPLAWTEHELEPRRERIREIHLVEVAKVQFVVNESVEHYPPEPVPNRHGSSIAIVSRNAQLGSICDGGGRHFGALSEAFIRIIFPRIARAMSFNSGLT